MTRLQALAARPRRTLGALAVVLAAVGITAGSSATFTASSANPTNTFSTGVLSMYNSKDGSAVLTASDLKPGGGYQSGTVDIQNTGTISGDFTLDRTIVTDTASLAPLLTVRVTDCGVWTDSSTANPCGDGNDVVKYAGGLDTQAQIALGAFAAGEKHTYKFEVKLDSAAGNPKQGKSATVQYDWNAIQN